MVEYDNVFSLIPLKEENDMAIMNLQVALFFKNPIERPDKFGTPINLNLDNFFDGALISLPPMPSDAPPQVRNIPTFQVKTSDGSAQFNVAQARADFILTHNTAKQTEEQFLVFSCGFAKKVTKLAMAIEKIDRIGLVANKFFISANPVSEIMKNYFDPRIKGANEVTFRINLPKSNGGIIFNDSLSVAQGTQERVTGRKKEITDGIIVTRDINSSIARKDVFDVQEALKIIDFAFERFPDSCIREAK